MMSLLLTLVLSVAHAQTASAPTTDFSGTWRMDPERSATAVQVEPVGPVTLVVTQTPNEVTVQTTTSGRTSTEVYRFDADGVVSAPGQAIAQWRDGALELAAVQTVSGQSVTLRQTWRLNQGGAELQVDSVLNVQHGYTATGAQVAGTGRDVYVRTPGR
jgi:hypothetical protein